jgi:hypothetical protein
MKHCAAVRVSHRQTWMTPVDGGIVARRTNYGFEKRQNELNRQKKKQEKLEKKRRSRAAGAADAAAAEDVAVNGSDDAADDIEPSATA